MSSGNKKMAFLGLMAIFLIIIDRWFKVVAINFLEQKPIEITNWFRLSFEFNKNIAFSLPLQGILLNIFIIILIVVFIIAYLYLKSKKNYLQASFIIFIILGAISNLFDRLKYGAVIDYLDLQYFTIFNIADAMIIIGSLSLIIIELKNEKNKLKK